MRRRTARAGRLRAGAGRRNAAGDGGRCVGGGGARFAARCAGFVDLHSGGERGAFRGQMFGSMVSAVSLLTSFVFRLGVDRDELEPDRDGGRCSADGFELLPPGLSPFRPMLSRSRSRTSSGWSPFGRGEGDSCACEQKSRGVGSVGEVRSQIWRTEHEHTRTLHLL